MKNIVEKIREDLGMSRKKFADALNVTYGCVSNYEYGSRAPSLAVSYRILALVEKYQCANKYKLEDICPPPSA